MLVKAHADDGDSLIAALTEHGPVDGAFLMMPPLVPNERENSKRIKGFSDLKASGL